MCINLLLTLESAYDIMFTEAAEVLQKGRNLAKSANNLIAKPSSTSMLTLGLLNCQSACNKANIIQDHIKDNNIDVLALTETWFKPKDNYAPA